MHHRLQLGLMKMISNLLSEMQGKVWINVSYNSFGIQETFILRHQLKNVLICPSMRIEETDS